MAAQVKTSGSITPAALDTEENITAAITTAGTYQLVVDTANLANGETVILRIYGKARSTDTERVIYESRFKHAQTGQELKASITLLSPHYWKPTIEQSGGTLRAYPWAVYEIV